MDFVDTLGSKRNAAFVRNILRRLGDSGKLRRFVDCYDLVLKLSVDLRIIYIPQRQQGLLIERPALRKASDPMGH